MFRSNIKNFWDLLDFESKKRAAILIPLTLLNSALELINIGILMPFIMLLTGDKIPFRNIDYLEDIINSLLKNSNLLALTFILIISITYLYRIFYTYKNIQFSLLVGASLNKRLFRTSVSESYENHIQTNSNTKVSLIASKSGTVITSIVLPLINSFNSILLLIVFYIFSGLYFGSIFYFVSFFVGFVYYLTILLTKNSIKNRGDIASIKTDALFKFLRETYDGIRELILSNGQERFSQNYYLYEKSLRESQIFISFMSQIPKILMEYLFIIFVVGFVFISRIDSNSNSIIIDVGILIYIAQKVLPLIHQLYSTIISIHSSKTILAEVLAMLYSSTDLNQSDKKNALSTPIKFNNKIELVNISFKYQSRENIVLEDINLNILKGTSNGFSGTTGSGKSTIIDIITSLLTPVKGQILIDGIKLSKSQYHEWINNFAYVPQKPFIVQGTVYDNLKLFSTMENIELANKAIKITNLYELSEDVLDYTVKENGFNLSGGQCQRLSIARAIYSNKEILVLDEPTSALDLKTALNIISSLKMLNKTLIIITHQSEILNLCDNLVFINNGRISNDKKS